MKVTVRNSTPEEIAAIANDPVAKKRQEAQLRVAVLGQLFMEALEDYEYNGGPKLKVGEKIPKIVKYIENGIKPIYDAYYKNDDSEMKETTRFIEATYDMAIKQVVGHHNFLSLAYNTNLWEAIRLDHKTVTATVHRILTKNKVTFIK